MRTDWLIVGIYAALFVVVVVGILSVYWLGGFG